MTTKPKSPAVQLIELVYHEQGHQMGRSNERFNAGMRDACQLAIRYGLCFDLDDFETLGAQRTASYYNTSIYLAGESEYTIACGKERGRQNQSACLSFEKWKNRKPFIVREPEEKTGNRIAVGIDFTWYGERTSCTSFADDGSYLIGCTYKRDINGFTTREVDHRIKITQGDIREYHATFKLIEEVKATNKKLSAKDREAMQAWFVGAFGEVKPSTLKTGDLRLILNRLAGLRIAETAA